MQLMGANGSHTANNEVDEGRCWFASCRNRRQSNEEHYKPALCTASKCAVPTTLEISNDVNDPTLLGSTVLINSWKAPSTANVTPPITPISSDSSYSLEGFSLSQPTHETLMQIIRCFPFPTPAGSSEPSPRCERKRQVKGLAPNDGTATFDGTSKAVERSRSLTYATKQIKASFTNVVRRKTEKSSEKPPNDVDSNVYRCTVDVIQKRSALERLAQVSVDTMAITALPLDCWLKERLKNWVQLSGHEGTIVPATDQTLWKRKATNDYTEAKAYRSLMQDPLLDGFVPRFYKEIDYKNDSFIEIQDLTAQFTNPAIMDIKIGTRTFSECDVQNNVKRADLYQKMIAQNPAEPTDEERHEMAITKLRYMQFRERESSTASLGFRIEAAKMPGGVLKKSFKKVKTRDEVIDTLRAFFGDHSEIVRKQFLCRLRRLRDAAQRSYFFKHHEVVGSSLLLVYDDFHASAWMIDFAKSVPIEGRIIDHRSEWKLGNHEDGYFTGLDNLIKIIDEMAPH
uniref:Kinase n=1 Tax=Ascaris suum TaxID=6253 RepID=F1L1H8_ASCSU